MLAVYTEKDIRESQVDGHQEADDVLDGSLEEVQAICAGFRDGIDGLMDRLGEVVGRVPDELMILAASNTGDIGVIWEPGRVRTVDGGTDRSAIDTDFKMKMRAGRITELCYTCLGKMTDTLSSFYIVVYNEF